MTQASNAPSHDEPLYSRDVLPDEIDKDPPCAGQTKDEVRAREYLSLFAKGVRGKDPGMIVLGIAGVTEDADAMGEVIVAGCRDFGIDVGDVS